MAFTAPQDAAVVTAANSADAVMPKRASFHVAAGLRGAGGLVHAQRRQQRVARLFGGDHGHDRGHEQHGHGRQHGHENKTGPHYI